MGKEEDLVEEVHQVQDAIVVGAGFNGLYQLHHKRKNGTGKLKIQSKTTHTACAWRNTIS